MASEQNPEQAVKKKDELLQQGALGEGVLGPEKAADYPGESSTLYFDLDQISAEPDSTLSDVFSHAGDLRSEMDVEAFADVLSALSATPRKDGEGYINRAGVLYAVDESIEQGMVLGLNDQTYRDSLRELEEANLLRLDQHGEPEITSTGRKVMDGMVPLVGDFDDYSEASSIFSDIAGKKNNPDDRLTTFLYAAETDLTFADISEELEVGHRAAVMRYDTMREDQLFIGEPDQRKVTTLGNRTYQAVVAMAHNLDEISDKDYFTDKPEF